VQRLYTAANLQEAYLLLHQLEQAGVAARVLNEHAYGAMGELPFTQAYPEVWIDRDGELVRAEKVLEAFRSRPPVHESVTCRFCGEHNPVSFELCWHCGATLETSR
jgi:hypothetical protein